MSSISGWLSTVPRKSDTNSNTNTDTNADTNTDTNKDTNTFTNTNTNTNTSTNTNKNKYDELDVRPVPSVSHSVTLVTAMEKTEIEQMSCHRHLTAVFRVTHGVSIFKHYQRHNQG